MTEMQSPAARDLAPSPASCAESAKSEPVAVRMRELREMVR
jgi:hypothetical protein